jgi:hypothetical protein
LQLYSKQQSFFLQPHRQSQVSICNTHNSWLQSRTPNSCNHTLAQFLFSFFCSHRNKPAVFAMRHFSFLQSLTTQACNHIPNNQVSFFNHTDKLLFLQPHIFPGCNHSRQIVAITHCFSFLFLFCSHRNKPAGFAMRHFSFLQLHTIQACNYIRNNQVAFQPHRQSQVSFFCNRTYFLVAITHANYLQSHIGLVFFFFFAVTEINQQILQ